MPSRGRSIPIPYPVRSVSIKLVGVVLARRMEVQAARKRSEAPGES